MKAKSAAVSRISEAQFLTQVLDLAKVYGYFRVHFRPAKTAHGWRTALSGDGVGFPDVLLAHEDRGRLIAAELKSEVGKATEAQLQWLAILAACGVETFLWRPSMLVEIAEILQGSGPCQHPASEPIRMGTELLPYLLSPLQHKSHQNEGSTP